MKRLCSLTGFTLLSAVCSGAPAASEFVGSWVNVQRAKDTVIIDRDGTAFVFKETCPSVFDGKMHTDAFPASVKDGQMTVTVGGFPVRFTVDKASGNLSTADGRRYARRG